MRAFALAVLVCLASGLMTLGTTELYNYASGTLVGTSNGRVFLQGGIYIGNLMLEEHFGANSSWSDPMTTFDYSTSIWYDDEAGQWKLHRQNTVSGGYFEWDRIGVQDSGDTGFLWLGSWNFLNGSMAATVVKDAYLDPVGQFAGWDLNAYGVTAPGMTVELSIRIEAEGENVPYEHYTQATYSGRTESLPGGSDWPWAGFHEMIGFYVYPGDSPLLDAGQGVRVNNEGFDLWGHAYLGPDYPW